MKHQLSKISVHDTAEALQDAEARLERPEANGGATVYRTVRPKDIEKRTGVVSAPEAQIRRA